MINVTKGCLALSRTDLGQAALQLAEQPSASELVLTSFPSINPMSAAQLISLGCSLRDLLTLSTEEQKQLAAKLPDIPANSLELLFQQAMWGQAITGRLPTAPRAGQQQPALECEQQMALEYEHQQPRVMHHSQHQRCYPGDRCIKTYDQNHSGSFAEVTSEQFEASARSGCLSHGDMPQPSQHGLPGQGARHATGLSRPGNPFGAFQCQPQHQSSSQSHGPQQLHGQLPPESTHGHSQHGHLLSMEPADCLQIEEVPADYTEDHSSDALHAFARSQHEQQQQHLQQQQLWPQLQQQHQQLQRQQLQQQQQTVDWQEYLPEEDEGILGAPIREQGPWQQPIQQRRFGYDSSAAAEMLPMHSTAAEEENGVPDVVIDDVFEPEAWQGIAQA